MEPLYIAGNTPIHRLHPLTKLAWLVFAMVCAYVIPIWGSLVVTVMSVAVAMAAGVAWPVIRRALLLLLPILISLTLIRGVFFPPTRTQLLYDFGWLTIWADGWLFIGRLWFRLFAVGVTIMLVVTLTHPADLTNALTLIGLPRSIGYIITVSIQLIPDMLARATGILEAQRSRGLETEGAVRRMLALPSLVGPLLIGALSDVQERAVTLEARAFLTDGPKTSWRQLFDSPVQRAARWLLLLGAVGLVIARFTLLRGIV